MPGAISGVVKDIYTNIGIQGATVRIITDVAINTCTTDVTGSYTTVVLNNGIYSMLVSIDSYETYSAEVIVSSSMTLPNIFLVPKSGSINSISPVVGSMFDRLQVAEFTPVFNVSPQYGITNLRDVVTTIGSGSVTNTGEGYTLTTSTVANDVATLDTAERGRFNVGSAFEAGIVLQIPTPPGTNTRKATWGIFDNSNGAYFGQDSTGVFVASLQNGSETKVYQSNWNTDKLDGTGLSGLTLNTNVGAMYQIRFGYSYGIIEYRVVLVDPLTHWQIPVTCHRQSATTGLLVGDLNQPIRARIENRTIASSTTFTMYVSGRYYANLGTTEPMNRLTSERRLTISANTTTFVPTVSFKRQSTFPSGSGKNNSINVTIDSFDIITSEDLIWQLRLNSTLTGASFGFPSETPSSETCVLSDVSATAINVSTGIKIMSGLESGAKKDTSLSSVSLKIVIPSTQTVTLCVKNICNNGTVSVVLRAHEEW